MSERSVCIKDMALYKCMYHFLLLSCVTVSLLCYCVLTALCQWWIKLCLFIIYFIKPCVIFLTCVHLALLLVLSLSPGNSLVSSWCDHSMLASLLCQCRTVPSYSSFVKNPLICFLCCPRNPQNLSQRFHLKGIKTCFFMLSKCPAFTAVHCDRPY